MGCISEYFRKVHYFKNITSTAIIPYSSKFIIYYDRFILYSQYGMKILHISSALSWRGGEQQLHYLCTGLTSLQQNIKQIVYCPKNSALAKKLKSSEDLKIHTYPRGLLYKIRSAKNLARLSIEEDVELIHIHDSHSHSIAYFSSLLFGNKTKMALSRKIPIPIKSISKTKYRLSNIRVIISVSNYVKQILKRSLPAKKITTIHDCVDLDKFNLNEATLKNEFKLSTQTKIIGIVAALTKEKDHLTFVRVAETLLSKNTNLHFLIIGDGPQRNKILKEIKSRNLVKSITLTGHRSDIDSLLPQLDLMLFCTKWEGLGSSALDAFCCEVPLVCSDVPGLNEIAIPGETALSAKPSPQQHIELAKHCEKLLSDETYRQQQINTAKNFVKNFDLFSFAKKHFELYLGL